uniref:Peroxidase n=1 Tax=Anthurium amnicola TaxID=1678845 RepID=A0A1D1Z001_9ARAE
MPRRIALFLALLLWGIPATTRGQLEFGFYANTCPNAETIVTSVVRNAVQSDNTAAPALLRLHFHDCIVQGCEGSILINRGDGQQENKAFGHQGLRGFEVIDQAKAQLESECPGVVSCADIVALAARDSVVLSNGPSYQVPTGRRDGRVSSISDASNMPDLKDSVDVLKSKFAQKGLSERDLVLLNGAHTIGTAACFFMGGRLYNFGGGGKADPSINPQFMPELKRMCPQNGDVNVRLALDSGSEREFDVRILGNIRGGFAVLESDARMYGDPSTRAVIDSYLDGAGTGGPSFESDFAVAVVKMGAIGVLTGSQGEIRRVCSSFN